MKTEEPTLEMEKLALATKMSDRVSSSAMYVKDKEVILKDE